MRVKLTDRSIRRTKPEKGTLELWDTACPGLALRIHAGGRRAYCVTTRMPGGKQIRRTIGTTTTHELAEARDIAREIVRNAQKGIDSHSRRALEHAARQKQVEEERARESTFRHVAETYLNDQRKGGGANLRSRQLVKRRLEIHVYPKWDDRPIHEITRRDVIELVDDVAQKTPIAANRVLSTVRRIFNWACARDLIDVTPVVGVEPPATEKSRERVLADEEIRQLWPAFDKLGEPFGPVFKILLLTGQRRNEVAGLKRSELDGDLWILPAERSKNGEAHTIPLAPLAREILDKLTVHSDADGNLFNCVFTTARKGDRPVSGWTKIKERVDRIVAEAAADVAGEPLDMKKHGLPHWTIHDFRRTVRTNLPRLGISPDTAERVLGHRIGGVRGVYDRHAYDREKRSALTAWAAHVENIVTGKRETSNLVEMKRGAG